MKKETFCKVIKLIKEQELIDEKFSDALSSVGDGPFVFDGGGKYLEALLLLLKEEMNDKCDYIEWWLYDGADKKVYVENEDTGEIEKEIDLSSVSSLYDFLVLGESVLDKKQ